MPKTRINKFGLVMMFVLMTAMLISVAAVVSLTSQTEGAGYTITVTNENDSGSGSLRAALASANDGDIIGFAPGVNTITLTTGQISFGQANITIDGGAGVTIERSSAAGTPNFRLMYSTATTGTLTLTALTFKNGNAAVTGSNTGGGLYAGSSVNMTYCTFDSNRSGAAGGGLFVNSGDTTLTNCIFNDNFTNSAGGGFYTNSSANLIGCVFTSNESTGGNGGGVRAFGNVTATDCTFTDNVTRSTTSSGGGIWSNNNVTLNGCVFFDNVARVHGSGVSAANGSLLIIINCTFVENKPFTTNPTNVGAIDCATRTFIFQTTIVENVGGGVYAGDKKTAYLYNSILTWNVNAGETAPLQTLTAGTGAIHNVSSLVEGSALLTKTPAGTVSHMEVFGMNGFDEYGGTWKVLSNGIAAGTAGAISVSNIIGYSGLSSSDRAALDAAIAALAFDQKGQPRNTSGDVTYGAVEDVEFEFLSITVDNGSANKVNYAVGDMIDLSGTTVELTFENGVMSGVPYDTEGISNTSAQTNMSTVGPKEIHFSFLGISTEPEAGLGIFVKDGTTTVITTTVVTSVNGETVTITVIVSTDNPGSGVVSTTGVVELSDETGTVISTATWTEPGTAVATVSLPAGDYTVTATYTGDPDFDESFDTLVLTVINSDTAVTVTGVEADGSFTYVTFSAYLSVVPPGSADLNNLEVTFFADDDIELGQGICNSDGVVSLTMLIANVPVHTFGEHTIYAVFGGSTGLNPSTSDDFTFNAGNEASNIDIDVSPDPAVFGEPVTITAKLLPETEGMTIRFQDNGSYLGEAVTNSSGEAVLTGITLPIGNHTLLAIFEGDDDKGLNGSAGWTIFYVGIPKSSINVIVTPATNETYDNPVTITATLSVTSPGEAVLTGKPIIFYNYTTIIGIVNCDVSGVASLSIVLPADTHNLSAMFVGDGNLYVGFSNYVSYEILQSFTTALLDVDNSTPAFGQTITFTATVTADYPGSGIPAGTVEFFDGGASMGTVQLNAAGKATIATSGLTGGSHDIVAYYLGNDNYKPSGSDQSTVVVDKASTETKLKATPTSSAVGKEATFLATVTSAGGTPSGAVVFYIDGVPMVEAPLDAGGVAAYSTSDLDIGTYLISATYLSTNVYEESDSNILQYKVSAYEDNSNSYLITATADQGATISPKGAVTVSGGANITFNFSAAAVKVDGVSLSQEEIASGSYTFSGVNANHTIDATGAGVPKQTYYLTIDVKEGNGRAEYSIGGSAFTAYTTTVSVQEGSSLRVRAVADGGYAFKEWKEGSTTYTSAEISFSSVNASMNLDLYFGEKSSSDNNNLLWWGIGLFLLILLLLLLILLWRRRKGEDEKGSY